MDTTPGKAERFLSNAPKDKYFKLHMGADISNLRELAECLDIMSNETFKHHVTEHKNDFVNWVRDVIGDKGLALELMKMKEKGRIANLIQKRVKFLESRSHHGKLIDSQEFMWFGTRDFLIGLAVGFLIALVVKYFITAMA